jgi:hypothetical protein
MFLFFKKHKATRGVVIFYSAGVVTHDHRIGSRFVPGLGSLTIAKYE